MQISTQDIQTLREKLGVGVMDAKRALADSQGDFAKAENLLRAKGAKSAEKRANRATNQGCIGSYVHSTGTVAGLVAVACETDFVARTDQFKQLAHDLALHVVAAKPKYLKPEDVPQEELAKEEEIWRQQLANEGKPEKMFDKILEGKRQKYYQEVCLLRQLYVKDDAMTVEQVVKEHVARLGENMRITGFSLLSL